MIRVLIAEDAHLIRGALVALLSLEPDIDVVAELDRGDQIVEAAASLLPDVAILDIDLPGCDGLTAARQLHEQVPRCAVLILTGLSQPGTLLRALQANVRGFIVKDAPAATLADGIRKVAAGQRVIDPELIAAALETGASPLTDRETDVLRAAQTGVSTEEIAATVGAVAGDGAQLPVERDQQSRRAQPHRRDQDRGRRRMATELSFCRARPGRCNPAAIEVAAGLHSGSAQRRPRKNDCTSAVSKLGRSMAAK